MRVMEVAPSDFLIPFVIRAETNYQGGRGEP